MQTITLARALKVKKLLVGKLAKVQAQITANNSVVAGTERVDVHPLFVQRTAMIGYLLDLKTGINAANSRIQRKLYELAETKGELAFFTVLSTVNGDTGQTHYGSDKAIVYESQMKREEKEHIVTDLESRIESIQEEIDQNNYTTKIEVEEEMLALAGVGSPNKR